MKLNFDPKLSRTSEEFEAILSHHDVVFRAPTHDPLYGLPIGNGDLGCLIHTEADRLHININKPICGTIRTPPTTVSVRWRRRT